MYGGYVCNIGAIYLYNAKVDTIMFDLYFKYADGSEVLVRKEIPSLEEAFKAVYKDLSNRRPNFHSYYNRYWENDDGDYWIDYGSHSEFYIAKKGK